MQKLKVFLKLGLRMGSLVAVEVLKAPRIKTLSLASLRMKEREGARYLIAS